MTQSQAFHHLVGGGWRSLDYVPFRNGVIISRLYGLADQGASAAILQYEPGAQVPLHRHPGFETIVVLDGAQRDARGTYRVGDVVVNPPGSSHDVQADETDGCVVLIIWQEPIEVLETMELFVNGTLMRGLGLHHNLAGAEFLGEFETAPIYRLYSIGDVHPGMFEVESGGVSVKGEYYRMSAAAWKRVEAGEPPNLYCGPVRLADARTVNGILFPRALAEGSYKDISAFGDWRTYMKSVGRG
jgi:gamma-glutamylcyclotransferase (GGCT)/AIG2-like uncharacterized protein YtfP